MLLREVLAAAHVQRGHRWVDGTFGRGGHSRALLEAGALVLGLDQDGDAAEAARALGVKVYTIGVGVRGKAPIPIRDQAGKTHMVLADVDVDEATLQAVANETGGQFYRATDTDSLQRIYEQINRYETSAQSVEKFEHVEELYRWTLLPSLGLLGVWVLLQHTRYRRLP